MNHHRHHSFWTRLAQLNAPFIAAALRHLADEIDLLIPGPPVVAVPVLFFTVKGPPQMGAITVPDSSGPLNATVTFLDAKGDDTTPDDVPVWASDNADAATVDASADATGLTAVVTIGNPGAAIISVTSTDTDGTVITSQGTVTVTPGEAVTGDVEFSAA